MNSLIIIFFAAYFLMVLWMLRHWVAARTHLVSLDFKPTKMITILVPFRNECQALPALLADLTSQHFPPNKFEIILIDDHSSDKGPDLVEQKCSQHHNLRLVKLTDGSGKKAALTLGISTGSGQLVITLDADMRLHSDWLRTISHYWETADKRFIILPISIAEGRSPLNIFQVIETDSLIGSTGAFARAGQPIMCNGGNLAFEKSLFVELGGYDDNLHIASGDDIFLLQKTKKAFPNSIGWIHARQAAAVTSPSPSLKSFLNQRIRWGAKTKYYKDPLPQWVAAVVAGSNLILVLGLILWPMNLVEGTVLVVSFISKTLVDGLFLWQVTRFFNHGKWFWAFPFVAIVYPFYILISATFGLFYSPRWKGR